MFFVNTTEARKRFKNLLGQANHFLITILIGLDGVEKGLVDRDVGFHAAWNPRDVQASARRSRDFALDLALVRVVDSLDAYMSWCHRKPEVIQKSTFCDEMDRAGNRVWLKLETFQRNIANIDPTLLSLTRLAVAWRNRRVHSLAENDISPDDRSILQSNARSIFERFRGLDSGKMLERFDFSKAPSFKEAASLIAGAHNIVQHFDRELIRSLDRVLYLKQMIVANLSSGWNQRGSLGNHLRRRAARVWGDEAGKQKRIENFIRSLGFSPIDSEGLGAQIPATLIDDILAWSPDDLVRFVEQ